MIDRYQLKEKLGEGGMAAVYKAYDPRFGRDVAIKLLPLKHIEDPSFRQRFEREARTIASLEHNAIVPVYDYGEHEGQLFLVMRLMPGGSLSERLQDKPISQAEITLILQRIGSALDKAHANNIVHRDLKPANILFDEDGMPYLSDFGIVKVAEGTTLTGTGGVIGTPAYMSPEQVLGQSGIDGRADIYALGAMLFQMLTGQLPYLSETTMGMAMMHVTSPVPQLQEANSDSPIAYQEIISRAMAKERDHRYQTVAEMVAAFVNTSTVPVPQTGVTEVIDPNDTYSTPPGLSTPARAMPATVKSKPAKRFRWLPVGIGLLVLAIIALVVLFVVDPFSFNIGEPTAASSVAEAAEDDEEDEERVSTETPAPDDSPDPVVDVTPTILPTVMPTVTSTAPPDDTAVPTLTSTPTTEPTATFTPAPTNTPTPVVQSFVLGRSSEGRSLMITQVGNGSRRLVLIGAMRGNEFMTERFVQELANYFQDNPGRVPPAATLYFLPALNPDGLVIDSRYTPGGVDLNRNWDTPSWVANAPEPGGIKNGSGGMAPFSEPETAALSDWLLELKADPNTAAIRIINHHHHTGVDSSGTVQPGYIVYGRPDAPSQIFAAALSELAGYQYVPTWDGPYTPTGEFIQWAAIQGFEAVDVEIPPSNGSNYSEQQIESILQMMIDSIITVMNR